MIDDVTTAHVRAFRWARQGLDRPSRGTARAVLDVGVPDTPEGSARLALSVRSADPLLPNPVVEGTSLVWSVRGAPHLHPARDLRRLASALWPTDDADAAARLLHLAPRLAEAGIAPLAGWRRAAEVMRAVVDRSRPVSEVSRRMTEQLPAAFSAWCESCGAVHVSPLLFTLVALGAGVELVPGEGHRAVQPVSDRYAVPGRASGTGELVRRYLRLQGPAAPEDVAAFLATAAPSVHLWWPDDLVELRVEGRPAFLLAEDLDEFHAVRPPHAVRLLPAHDPFLLGHDHEVLVPGADRRREVWRGTPGVGVVVVDADVAGTWTVGHDDDRALVVRVTSFEDWPTARNPELLVEAERLAVTCGRSAADVDIGAG